MRHFDFVLASLASIGGVGSMAAGAQLPGLSPAIDPILAAIIAAIVPLLAAALIRGGRVARRALAAALRSKGKALLTDKDKSNDGAGAALIASAAELEKDNDK